MPPGKSSPALFELMAGQRAAATPRSAVEIKPIPSASSEPPDNAASEPSPEPARRDGLAWTVDRKRPLIFDPGRVVSLPIGGIYVIGAILFAIVVIGWSVSYKKGRADEEGEWRKQLGAADPMLKLEEPAIQPRNVPVPAASGPEASPLGPSQPRESTAHAPGEQRIAGNNYLHVATLDRSETERLIAFLAGNGIEAMGTLDTTQPAANNQPRFWVFTLHPIPSGQYTAMARERKEHENEVARLGKVWKKDHGGTTDLSGTLWRLYKP